MLKYGMGDILIILDKKSPFYGRDGTVVRINKVNKEYWLYIDDSLDFLSLGSDIHFWVKEDDLTFDEDYIKELMEG